MTEQEIRQHVITKYRKGVLIREIARALQMRAGDVEEIIAEHGTDVDAAERIRVLNERANAQGLMPLVNRLGTAPDAVLVREFGVSKTTIWEMRDARCIPAFSGGE